MTARTNRTTLEASREGGPIDGPLVGVRILELGSLIAGPFAGRLLADLGAEVIKVEAPERHDPLREWGQEYLDGRSLWWPVMNRNKKLITLDLQQESDRASLLELAQDSDAMIENFRPGTLERWELGSTDSKGSTPRSCSCASRVTARPDRTRGGRASPPRPRR